MPNLTENLMSFSDFRLKVAKRILETIIEKHLSPVRSMLIINSSYTFYSSNKIDNAFAKNNYYPRAIYERKNPTSLCIYRVYLYTDINELNNQNS